MRNYHEGDISAGGLIALALGLLILPLRWLLAAMIAAGFHELCHLAAVKLCGGYLESFWVGWNGAVMRSSLSRGRELICILAGPLGSLLLLIGAQAWPLVAVCVLVQSAYNLLPLYPLDGGRAIRCIAALLWEPCRAARFVFWTERICILVIVAAAIFACVVLRLGIGPVLLGALVIARKIPCKQADLRVQ